MCSKFVFNACKPVSTLLIRTLNIFEVDPIRDFVRSGFLSILDFVLIGVLFIRDLVLFGGLSILDFAQFGILSIWDLVKFGILSIQDFVHFGILSVRDFVHKRCNGALPLDQQSGKPPHISDNNFYNRTQLLEIINLIQFK